MTFFFLNWATKRGSGRAGRETEGPTYTHSCPVPGHRSMEGTKRRQMQTTFFLPKRLQISPPVHLRLAWGVSGACCVPWDQCGGPCSLRSPWFLFWRETPTFSPLSPLEKKTKQKKLCTAIKRGNIRTLFALLSRPGRILAGLSRSLLLLLQHKAHVREVT